MPTVSAASTAALAMPVAGRQRWQSLAHHPTPLGRWRADRKGSLSETDERDHDDAVGFLRTRPLYVTGPWAGSPAENLRMTNGRRSKPCSRGFKRWAPPKGTMAPGRRWGRRAPSPWQSLETARVPALGVRTWSSACNQSESLSKKRPTSHTSLDPDHAPLTCSNRSRTTPLCLRRRCGAASELAKVDARVRGHGCIRNGL